MRSSVSWANLVAMVSTDIQGWHSGLSRSSLGAGPPSGLDIDSIRVTAVTIWSGYKLDLVCYGDLRIRMKQTCCFMYNTLNNPSAHPSYSHYYLSSPSTLFFFFLHILLFFAHLIVFCTSYCFLHILLFCIFLFHCTFYSYFSFFTIHMPLCCVTLYNLNFYYFALSTERTWFDYISLLIIPCIIHYVTNKETLNPWTLTIISIDAIHLMMCQVYWVLWEVFPVSVDLINAS